MIALPYLSSCPGWFGRFDKTTHLTHHHRSARLFLITSLSIIIITTNNAQSFDLTGLWHLLTDNRVNFKFIFSFILLFTHIFRNIYYINLRSHNSVKKSSVSSQWMDDNNVLHITPDETLLKCSWTPVISRTYTRAPLIRAFIIALATLSLVLPNYFGFL